MSASEERREHLTVAIPSRDPRLSSADVTIIRNGRNEVESVEVHTGKLLGRKAHSLIGIVLHNMIRSGMTSSDCVKWLSTESAIDTVINQFYSLPTAPVQSPTKYRSWLYFHHLCSPAKVSYAIDWAEELQVCGIVIPGQPGAMVIEGSQASVENIQDRMRLFSWRDYLVIANMFPRAQIPWENLHHIKNIYPDVVRLGAATKGRDTTDYSSLCSQIHTSLNGDLLTLLPAFTNAVLPKEDCPPAKPISTATSSGPAKKKKNRLQK